MENSSCFTAEVYCLKIWIFAYPDFPGIHALVPQCAGTTAAQAYEAIHFFLEQEDRIVRTTPSGIRIVSTRIRKVHILCI